MVWVSSMISSVPLSRVKRRRASWYPGSGRTIPMLVSAGSASTAATSPGASAASSASTSLKGTIRVVVAGSAPGRWHPLAGRCDLPSRRSPRFRRPFRGSTSRGRRSPRRWVSWRDSRSANRLASVALDANCHAASPKRRDSSAPTHAASTVGSIAVIPRCAWATMASVTAGTACPPIAPVSPRQRSTYPWPSMSTNRPPSRVGHEQWERPRPAPHPRHRHPRQQVLARRRGCFPERGWVVTKRSCSASSSRASRARSIVGGTA